MNYLLTNIANIAIIQLEGVEGFKSIVIIILHIILTILKILQHLSKGVIHTETNIFKTFKEGLITYEEEKLLKESL